jgi:hypothetical protein
MFKKKIKTQTETLKSDLFHIMFLVKLTIYVPQTKLNLNWRKKGYTKIVIVNYSSDWLIEAILAFSCRKLNRKRHQNYFTVSYLITLCKYGFARDKVSILSEKDMHTMSFIKLLRINYRFVVGHVA